MTKQRSMMQEMIRSNRLEGGSNRHPPIYKASSCSRAESRRLRGDCGRGSPKVGRGGRPMLKSPNIWKTLYIYVYTIHTLSVCSLVTACKVRSKDEMNDKKVIRIFSRKNKNISLKRV